MVSFMVTPPLSGTASHRCLRPACARADGWLRVAPESPGAGPPGRRSSRVAPPDGEGERRDEGQRPRGALLVSLPRCRATLQLVLQGEQAQHRVLELHPGQDVGRFAQAVGDELSTPAQRDGVDPALGSIPASGEHHQPDATAHPPPAS
ncbi:MAG: hypothetical protein KatS3mg060_2277 [Dehalococcoidia bacterium]|nr:MAG: hypothetical protein KatS3mg060_2277 [Dehalococcoidia bacterium]